MELNTVNLGKVSFTVDAEYWSSNKQYDRLTIVEVKDEYLTYVSRKDVPIGVELSDRDYWIPFSNLKQEIVLDYHAFIERYSNELVRLANEIATVDNNWRAADASQIATVNHIQNDRLNPMQASITSIEGELTTINNNINTLTLSCNDLSSRITTNKETIQTAVADINSINSTISSITTSINTINNSLTTINSKLGIHTSDIEGIKRWIAGWESERIISRLDDIDDRTAMFDWTSTEAIINRHERNIGDNVAAINNIRESLNNIQTDLDVLSDTVSTYHEYYQNNYANVGSYNTFSGENIFESTTTFKGYTTIETNLQVDGALNAEYANLRILSVELALDVQSMSDFYGEVFIHNKLNVDGDLTIHGNIYQSGESYITHAEHIHTENDYIVLRKNSISGLTDEEFTGLKAINYNGSNSGLLVFSNKGEARVGDIGDTQPLLTRDEKDNIPDGALFKWNANTNRAEPLEIRTVSITVQYEDDTTEVLNVICAVNNEN